MLLNFSDGTGTGVFNIVYQWQSDQIFVDVMNKYIHSGCAKHYLQLLHKKHLHEQSNKFKRSKIYKYYLKQNNNQQILAL